VLDTSISDCLMTHQRFNMVWLRWHVFTRGNK